MISFGASSTPMWLDYLLWFLAGGFLANGVPHFVQGICGSKFPTPFARFYGTKDSPALVNVLWGWFNFAAAGYLIYFYYPKRIPQAFEPYVVTSFGALALAIYLAWRFEKAEKKRRKR